MHGDSLLMLTTKVVSNKKPPLLSDSESGGSTSHEQLPFYILVNVISFAVAFTITWFFGYNSKMETGTEKVEQEENIAMNKVDLNENNKVVEIASPLKGEVLPLNEVKDEAFASGILGNGIAINPKEGVLVSPVNGV